MSADIRKLLVPGDWCKACGFGDVDRMFDVIRVRNFGIGRTFVLCRVNEFQTFEVWVEERGATLFETGK